VKAFEQIKPHAQKFGFVKPAVIAFDFAKSYMQKSCVVKSLYKTLWLNQATRAYRAVALRRGLVYDILDNASAIISGGLLI